MKQIAVLNEKGDKAGEVKLPDSYFGAEISEAVLYYSVNATLTNHRQGTVETKTRGQIAASTKKPWRQKGTGRARAGMRSSPLWRGGGTVFGPHTKNYDVRLPKKVRLAALRSALSAKAAQEGAIVVIENLEFDKPKTKRISALLEGLQAGNCRVLIMSDGYKPVVLKSVRNIPRVEIKPFVECNAYDVLLAEKLIIEKSVIEQLEQKAHEGPLPDSEAAPADGAK